MLDIELHERILLLVGRTRGLNGTWYMCTDCSSCSCPLPRNCRRGQRLPACTPMKPYSTLQLDGNDLRSMCARRSVVRGIRCRPTHEHNIRAGQRTLAPRSCGSEKLEDAPVSRRSARMKLCMVCSSSHRAAPHGFTGVGPTTVSASLGRSRSGAPLLAPARRSRSLRPLPIEPMMQAPRRRRGAALISPTSPASWRDGRPWLRRNPA